jgi:glycosyltransferase involved in cell wall biosynthesis
MARSSLSFIITTYEWPEALNLVLRAFSEEDDDDFEILIADDGSGRRTADVVDSWGGRVGRRIEHVWQPNERWRKARVENLAALRARRARVSCSSTVT